MSKRGFKDVKKSSILTVLDNKSDRISKIISPSDMQVGLLDERFSSNFLVTGNAIVKSGITGSLTELYDGTPYLRGGEGIIIVTGSDGSVTITSTGGGGGGSGDITAVNTSTGLLGGDTSGSVTLSIDDSVVATLSGSVFSGRISAPSITGSLTSLQDGSSYIVQGDGIGVISQSNGSILLSADRSIGDAEDGSYADGLFTDLLNTTAIGTVVDRFNEILKALAPGPAPSLDDIDFNNSSVSGKLSFGASNTISGYTNSNTAAGFSAVDVDGTYQSSTSGNNLRIGLLNGSTAVTGDLNEDVSADTHSSGQANYVANSFGDAATGSLKLEVNGAVVHTVVLTGSNLGHIGSGVPGSGTANSTNSNGSGFTNLSATGSAVFSDGTELDLFQHRTGRYTVASSDQRNGWNYARVIHSLPSGDVNTNYVEWINDSDGNALSVAGDVFDTLLMQGDLRLSGVRYHMSGTAEYRVRVLNAYKNVYTTSNITFSSTNCTISNQSMPASGNNEDKILHITGSATISASSLLNESITTSVNVPHPLKSNISGGGSRSISGILMWAYSNNSTVVSETFRRENFRLISGSYNSQSNVTDASNTWDGTKHMSGTNTGHEDGLMFYNRRLYSPSQGLNSGDFSSVSNGPINNVDYSGITSGTRTFYRYFQNNSGGSKTGFSLTIEGSGTIVSNATAFNSSRIKVFCKIPTTTAAQSTGWMDLATAFATGQVGDNDGCLEGALDSSLDATNIVTFGTQFVTNNEYIMIKILADASFTGYISTITVSWS